MSSSAVDVSTGSPSAVGSSRLAALHRSLFQLQARRTSHSVTRPKPGSHTHALMTTASLGASASSGPVAAASKKKATTTRGRSRKRKQDDAATPPATSPTCISEFDVLSSIPLIHACPLSPGDEEEDVVMHSAPIAAPTRPWSEMAALLSDHDRRQMDAYEQFITSKATAAATATAALVAPASVEPADADANMADTAEEDAAPDASSTIPLSLTAPVIPPAETMPPPAPRGRDRDRERERHAHMQRVQEKLNRRAAEHLRARELDCRKDGRKRSPTSLAAAAAASLGALVKPKSAVSSFQHGPSARPEPRPLPIRQPLATMLSGSGAGAQSRLGMASGASAAGLPPKHQIGVKRSRFGVSAAAHGIGSLANAQGTTASQQQPPKTARAAWLESHPHGLKSVRHGREIVAVLRRKLGAAFSSDATANDAHARRAWEEERAQFTANELHDMDRAADERRFARTTPLTQEDAADSYVCAGVVCPKPPHHALAECPCDPAAELAAGYEATTRFERDWLELPYASISTRRSRSTSQGRATSVERGEKESSRDPSPVASVVQSRSSSQQAKASLTPTGPSPRTPRTPLSHGGGAQKNLSLLPPAKTPLTTSTFASTGRSNSTGAPPPAHVSRRSASMRQVVQQIHGRSSSSACPTPRSNPHTPATLTAHSPLAPSVGESPLLMHQAKQDDEHWLKRRVQQALETRMPNTHAMFNKATKLILHMLNGFKLDQELLSDSDAPLTKAELKHLCTEKLEESLTSVLSKFDPSTLLPPPEEQPPSVQVKLAGLASRAMPSASGADSPASVALARVTPLHFPSFSSGGLLHAGVASPPVQTAGAKTALNHFTNMAMLTTGVDTPQSSTRGDAAVTTPQMRGHVHDRWANPRRVSSEQDQQEHMLVRSESLRTVVTEVVEPTQQLEDFDDSADLQPADEEHLAGRPQSAGANSDKENAVCEIDDASPRKKQRQTRSASKGSDDSVKQSLVCSE